MSYVPSYGRGAGSDPFIYLHAIRRHWFFGLVVGVLLAATAGASTWFLIPKSYTATALIEVAMREDFMVFSEKSYNLQQEYIVFKGTPPKPDLLWHPMGTSWLTLTSQIPYR